MAYNTGYAYPPLNYMAPDPYRTTYLPHHNFQARQSPVPHIRRSISHAFDIVTHPFGHEQAPHIPATDVRESAKCYYIDVELPGLDSTENVKIRWINSHTLLIEGNISRPVLEEEVGGAPLVRTRTRDKEPGAKDNAKEPTPEQTVFLTMHERKMGKFTRALSFATDVDHEKLQARLHSGLLLLTVIKKENAIAGVEHKKIEVNNTADGTTRRKDSVAWPGLSPAAGDVEEFKERMTDNAPSFPGLMPL